MAENPIHALGRLGQSVWLDSISRWLIKTGKLKDLIGRGVSGLTSNPSIFHAAVSSGADYDEDIRELAKRGKSAVEILDELTTGDVRAAADLFLATRQSSGGREGFVSLEIDPRLAHKTGETIKEGRRLAAKVGRPNLMLKVPATDEGLAAVEQLTAQGLNVNVTLIFCPVRYARAARAYMKGIAALIEKGGSPWEVRSVASVFVSRIDTKADKLIDDAAAATADPDRKERLKSLRSRAAVANAALIYALFRKLFEGGEFAELLRRGANPQRIVWGSTGAKDKTLSDIKYVTELVGRDTINTLPEQTLTAFLDHGKARETLTQDATAAEKILADLSELGIDIYPLICAKLLEEGLTAFQRSFSDLLSEIDKKSKEHSR